MLQSSKDRARAFIVDLSLEFQSCPVPIAAAMTIRGAAAMKIYAAPRNPELVDVAAVGRDAEARFALHKVKLLRRRRRKSPPQLGPSLPTLRMIM
jgi:hypothetical protein